MARPHPYPPQLPTGGLWPDGPHVAFNQVADRLWIGDSTKAPDDRFEQVVTLDGSVARGVPYTREVPETVWDIPDGPLPDETRLVALADQVNVWRAENTTVLVRCAMGLSRSALLVATVLVRNGQQPAAAIEQVRAARSVYALDSATYCRWLFDQATVPSGCR